MTPSDILAPPSLFSGIGCREMPKHQPFSRTHPLSSTRGVASFMAVKPAASEEVAPSCSLKACQSTLAHRGVQLLVVGYLGVPGVVVMGVEPVPARAPIQQGVRRPGVETLWQPRRWWVTSHRLQQFRYKLQGGGVVRSCSTTLLCNTNIIVAPHSYYTTKLIFFWVGLPPPFSHHPTKLNHLQGYGSTFPSSEAKNGIVKLPCSTLWKLN
mmetsp:Transcript_18559/g.23992  ORF Transcript_18559/g.23992 Transcript_18559/m.23992 type:complete len:211 (+) Transcript_18559:46-678(+)